jgi:hypothetical protein
MGPTGKQKRIAVDVSEFPPSKSPIQVASRPISIRRPFDLLIKEHSNAPAGIQRFRARDLPVESVADARVSLRRVL